ANHLTMNGSFTIAAAHGRTFNIGTGGWQLFESPGSTINFGAAGQDGTVVWSYNGSSAITNFGQSSVEVRAGTLKAGGGALDSLLANSLRTTVDAGATIDIAGIATTISALQGQGTVTNSGALATLTLPAGTSFLGNLSGALNVHFNESSSLY